MWFGWNNGTAESFANPEVDIYGFRLRSIC
jgi:hypothetical protein